MPKILRDFICHDCGNQSERFIDVEVDSVDCGCGSKQYRMIGMPRVALDGTDASFPGAYNKWANVREENARLKAKRSYAE